MPEFPQERAAWQAWAGLPAIGSVLGAVGASGCCVLPVVLFALGATGPWIGELAAFSPYQPYLLAFSIAAIGVGVFELCHRARVECSGDSCAAPRRRFLVKAALGFAAALVMLNLVWPRILPLLFG
ncbi:MAG TPA: mercuric transporter MerT family protein [Alphaproteobacteria bacterium]|nr:mercuric transporter MerT family protein [Alphaproteobacteria bacterium]